MCLFVWMCVHQHVNGWKYIIKIASSIWVPYYCGLFDSFRQSFVRYLFLSRFRLFPIHGGFSLRTLFILSFIVFFTFRNKFHRLVPKFLFIVELLSEQNEQMKMKINLVFIFFFSIGMMCIFCHWRHFTHSLPLSTYSSLSF